MITDEAKITITRRFASFIETHAAIPAIEVARVVATFAWKQAHLR